MIDTVLEDAFRKLSLVVSELVEGIPVHSEDFFFPDRDRPFFNVEAATEEGKQALRHRSVYGAKEENLDEQFSTNLAEAHLHEAEPRNTRYLSANAPEDGSRESSLPMPNPVIPLPVISLERAGTFFPEYTPIDLGALPGNLHGGFIVEGASSRPQGGASPLGHEYAVALAFSGGLDSRLLAGVFRLMGVKPLLFHIFGPHSIVGESLLALRRAHAQGFSVVCLPMNPLTITQVRANGRRRCYYCKREIFTRIQSVSPLPVCDGTLASDLLEYRPGLQALRELGVISPLALAGFDKALVTQAAYAIGLDNPGQLSQSCLLTRFGYGEPFSDEILRNLALADVAVKQYLGCSHERKQGAPAYQGVVPGVASPETTSLEATPLEVTSCEAKPYPLIPYYSLRLPDMGRLVLHLEGMDLPLAEQKRLSVLVEKAAPALPPLRVERVERVKGFFDRQPS